MPFETRRRGYPGPRADNAPHERARYSSKADGAGRETFFLTIGHGSFRIRKYILRKGGDAVEAYAYWKT